MTDEIEKLLKLAGPRADIPHGVEQRTYELVRREWQASTQQPDTRKTYKHVYRAWRRNDRIAALFSWSLPLGGVTAAIIAILVVMRPDPLPSIAVATITKSIQTTEQSRQYANGSSIFAGDTLTTGEDEGLSLMLARSESLRVDENTSVRVDAKDRFTLLRGRIYFDTGQFVYRDGGVTVTTSFGAVTDVGTQFSVSTNSTNLDVAVREGRVDISNDDMAQIVMVGERLVVERGTAPRRSDISPYDEHWSWVADLAPDFDNENRSQYDFLRWAARETGRELLFANDKLRMSAMRNDSHGDISGLTPDEALRAVLPTTTLLYRIEADKIVIAQ